MVYRKQNEFETLQHYIALMRVFCEQLIPLANVTSFQWSDSFAISPAFAGVRLRVLDSGTWILDKLRDPTQGEAMADEPLTAQAKVTTPAMSGEAVRRALVGALSGALNVPASQLSVRPIPGQQVHS